MTINKILMAIRNLRDIRRKRQQLEFEAKFYKKDLMASAGGVLGNFSAGIRSLAFDIGFRAINKFIFSRNKS